MRATVYLVAATVVTLGLATSAATAETKRVNKGRAGYTYMKVKDQRDSQASQDAKKRAKTIGLHVGDPRRAKKRAVKAGGRSRVGLQKVRG